MKKYESAYAFRMALESHLRKYAQERNIDLVMVRRKVSFDRFLCRIVSMDEKPFILKGGYALELRSNIARATKDLDIAFPDSQVKSHEQILNKLRESIEQDVGDWFTFIITDLLQELHGPRHRGGRFLVESRLEDRTFSKFHLDIAYGDFIYRPTQEIQSEDWLGFVGIPARTFPVVIREQHFAEKIHAYTRNRNDRVNTRVKDLIDMVLLINSTPEMDLQKVRDCLNSVFIHEAEHTIPMALPLPPQNWGRAFQALASECKLDVDIEKAFEMVSEY